MMTDLTFDQLRAANIARLPQFKNGKGEPAHSKPDGSDWSLSAWSNAVLGELGEAANLIKKIERGDFSLDEKREELGKEFADVQTYLDILAFRAGVDLGDATMNKWNEVSRRVGCDLRLGEETDQPVTTLNMALEQKRWLFDWMDKEKHLMAVAGSEADKKFQELHQLGIVKLYDAMFGNHYYALTDVGRKAIRP